MKIEIMDPAASPASPQLRPIEKRLVRRTLLTVALAFCLIAALQWALNVTSANARQVSSNLTNLQGSIDEPLPGSSPTARGRGGHEKSGTNGTDSGLILEPVDPR